MPRLATRIVFAFALVCAAGVSTAHAQNLLFDYVGFDYEFPNGNPGVFGDIGEGYQGVGEVPVLYPPLISNQAANQYTYFFDNLTVTGRSSIPPFVIIDYSPGTLTIYEDSRSSGTAATYGINPPNGTAPPTFVDGTAILVGTLTNFRYLYNTATNTGSFEADFQATGGSQFGNLTEVNGWTFSGTSGNSSTIPTGYAHQVDGQTWLNAPTPTRPGSWGGLKARYR